MGINTTQGLHSASRKTLKNLSKFKAWAVECRYGPQLVAGECPHCGGIHRHGMLTDDEEIRISHCNEVFIESEGSHEYEIIVQDGPPPDWLVAALDWPLEELATAYRYVLHPRKAVFVRPTKEQKDERMVWVPDPSDIKFALRALRRCGALDEVAAFREERGNIPRGKAVRGAVAEVWLKGKGPTMRQRLLYALRACWLRHGGPA
ncbi:hypothetical protein [Microvirga thermotolerans]|uniref:Uncharacterized protein n=1 Tax=Microvirga thermotolerans TaxID=2651334 RepID=A0A5P9JRG2_9HYPH|nr:hypothetical protein [Microvirga thermotolerans]QFU15322.1 hypothetical protein GDR74_03270 [Microvirga thermotolerans]